MVSLMDSSLLSSGVVRPMEKETGIGSAWDECREKWVEGSTWRVPDISLTVMEEEELDSGPE